MTRRTLFTRALAALASVPVVGRLWAEPMTRAPEYMATCTFHTLGRLQRFGYVNPVNNAAYMLREREASA